MSVSRIFVVFLLPLLGACRLPDSVPDVEGRPVRESSGAPLSPDTVLTLPRVLDEISGLAFSSDGRLFAVQDEDGDLFELDPGSGAILARARFAGDGDFEAVATSGREVFVLRSDARLYRITAEMAGHADLEATRIQIDLHGSCDAEGLAVSDRFLMACKENPGSGLRRVRAIYSVPRDAFDHPARRVEPSLVLALAPPAENSATAPLPRGRFKPSDLTLSPDSSFVYLVSSVSRTLHAFSLDGNPLGFWQLPESLRQPEGLAFSPDGRLFVASEADGTRARLAVFSGFGR